MKMNSKTKFTIFIAFFSISLIFIQSNQSFASETLDIQGDLPFSLKIPQNWLYEKNVSFSNSGWALTLYDSQDWSISTDISQYEAPISLNSFSQDEIIETSFLSAYYVCQDNVYEKIPFDELDSRIQNLLLYHHQKELSEFFTDLEDVYEWYSYVSEDELKEFFAPKIIDSNAPVLEPIPEIDQYLQGDMCSDFIPIEYEIIETENYIRYQIFYTWKQNFADGTYFDHFSTSDDIIINSKSKSYVINFDTKSSYDDYYSHLQSIDQIISSLKILEPNLLEESKISQDTKTQVGLWASDTSSNFEMYYEIEYLVNEGIMDRPSFLSQIHEIKVNSVPEWLKNIALWYYEGQLTDDEFLNMLSYLINEKFIKFEILDKIEF